MTRWRVAVTCCLVLAFAGCRRETAKPPAEPVVTEDGVAETSGPDDTSPTVAPVPATGRAERSKPVSNQRAQKDPADPASRQPGVEVTRSDDPEVPGLVLESRDALLAAIREGDVENAKKALAAHPEWAAGEEEGHVTMLHIAALSGSPELVSQLLDLGLDVNAMTLASETPLHLACVTGQTETIKLLLKNKAEVDAKSETGETPLHVAAGLGYKDAVMTLLVWSADPNAANNLGNTPLHEAAREGSTAVARRLFTRNIDVNARNAEGETPLAIAKKYGNKWMIQLLQQKGGVGQP